VKWIGLVGHVGRETDSDQRRLAPNVQWQLSRPVRPLFCAPEMEIREVIGHVDLLVQVGEDLFAAGSIDDDAVPSIAGLYPEIDLDEVEFTRDGNGLMTCTSGRICAVTLGTTPAWGDVWIRTAQ